MPPQTHNLPQTCENKFAAPLLSGRAVELTHTNISGRMSETVLLPPPSCELSHIVCPL